MAQKKGTAAKKTTTSKSKAPEPGYQVVVSVRSASLNYTANRLGELVSEQMLDGWGPHGSPVVAIDQEQYVMSQAMTRI